MQKNVPRQWQGNRSQAVVVSVGEAQGILTPFYTVDGNRSGRVGVVEGELCFPSLPHIFPGLVGSYGQGSGPKNYRTFLCNGNHPLGSANLVLLKAKLKRLRAEE